MQKYEYEVLTLKRVASPGEHDFRWHSDRYGSIGEPHEIAQVMNARGQDGWHIGTHVADGRWGNMLIIEREIPSGPCAAAEDLLSAAPLPPTVPIGDNEAVISGLQAIHASLEGLTLQMAQPVPVIVQVPEPMPRPDPIVAYPPVMQMADPQLLMALKSLQEQLAQMVAVSAAPTHNEASEPVPAVKTAAWILWLRNAFRFRAVRQPIPA